MLAEKAEDVGRKGAAPSLRRLSSFGTVAFVSGCLVAAALLFVGGERAIPPAIVLGGLAAYGVVVLGRWIVEPLNRARFVIERFGSGDTSLRLDTGKGPHEFRDFAAAFNTFAATADEREKQAALVLEATGDVVWTWSSAANLVTWRGEVRALFGIGTDHFSADSSWWHARVHPQERASVEAALFAALGGMRRYWSEEYRFRHEDGSYRWFWDRGVIVRDGTGAAVSMVGCMTDISARRAAEERIWQLANHDELTGLFNRKVFQSRLDSLVAASPHGRGGALILIDIDQFKDINDSLGHPAGDALLKEIGDRVGRVAEGVGTVFRLGGDEFAILAAADRATAIRLAESVLDEVRLPVRTGDRTIGTRATIGMALYPDDAGSAAMLLQNADLALYEGKARGRDQLVCFDRNMRTALDYRIRLLADVRQGLAEGRFEPHYQPIVSLADGALLGVEALMRWRHPVDGVVTPDRFAAALEEPETSIGIGDCLVERVIADFGRWGVNAPPYVAINLSSAVVQVPQFAENLVERIQRSGLRPSQFCVELTETLLFGKHSEAITSAVRVFHAAGVRIALDDFGTGYASLTHLQKFPVDVIKIDQSFIRSIATDRDSQAITATVLELGRRLGKDVIAEGVETAEHAIILRAAGCSQAQGFYFARAMPAEALGAYVAAQHRQSFAEAPDRHVMI